LASPSLHQFPGPHRSLAHRYVHLHSWRGDIRVYKPPTPGRNGPGGGGGGGGEAKGSSRSSVTRHTTDRQTWLPLPQCQDSHLWAKATRALRQLQCGGGGGRLPILYGPICDRRKSTNGPLPHTLRGRQNPPFPAVCFTGPLPSFRGSPPSTAAIAVHVSRLMRRRPVGGTPGPGGGPRPSSWVLSSMKKNERIFE